MHFGPFSQVGVKIYYMGAITAMLMINDNG